MNKVFSKMIRVEGLRRINVRNYKPFIAFMLAILMMSSCSMPGQEVTPPVVSKDTMLATPLIIQTNTPLPVHTETASPTLTSTTAPSATPFIPFTASVWAENVNVRTNPGYFFPALRLIKENSSLTVLGKAPGGEWVYARIPDGTEGWIFAQLIESSVDLQTIPIIEPTGIQLIRGRVTDSQGVPIQGVGFSVLQGAGENRPSNHVLTDSNGEFYSFMPLSARGEWTVIL